MLTRPSQKSRMIASNIRFQSEFKSNLITAKNTYILQNPFILITNSTAFKGHKAKNLPPRHRTLSDTSRSQSTQ